MPAYTNHLLDASKGGVVCATFGIKIVRSIEIVSWAKNAGWDALFIDLEHSSLTMGEAHQLCLGALTAGLSPYVRVPAHCGPGYVQKVLDNGAMGIIFPHISNTADAIAAVRMCKYPPIGTRSVVGPLPQLSYAATSLADTIEIANQTLSSVILMIETKEGLENIVSIAAVEGVDCIFVGTNDLTVELGVPGDFDCETFSSAMKRIADIANKHGKALGLAGIYNRPDLLRTYIHELGFSFVVGSQDIVLLTAGNRTSGQAFQELASKK